MYPELPSVNTVNLLVAVNLLTGVPMSIPDQPLAANWGILVTSRLTDGPFSRTESISVNSENSAKYRNFANLS